MHEDEKASTEKQIPNRCISNIKRIESVEEDVGELKSDYKTLSKRFDGFSDIVSRFDVLIKESANDRAETKAERIRDREELKQERAEQRKTNQATVLALQEITISLSNTNKGMKTMNDNISDLEEEVDVIKTQGTINWIKLTKKIFEKVFIALGGSAVLYLIYQVAINNL